MTVSDTFTMVSTILIYMGAFVFILCFLFGAYAFVQVFKTTLQMVVLTQKWNKYHQLSPEAKLDFLKRVEKSVDNGK